MKIKVQKKPAKVLAGASSPADNGAVADRFKIAAPKNSGPAPSAKSAKVRTSGPGVITTAIAFTAAIVALLVFAIVAFMLYDSHGIISRS